jgi:hypothetical protein
MLHLLPFAAAVLTLTADGLRKPEDEPLLDWSPWEKYRATVVHPAATLKPADLERARANLERYAWARSYRESVERGVRDWVAKLTPEFLVQMIPATTPGDTLFTPCPACRDLGKPMHPHGQWNWSAEDPDHLVCRVCGTVFPHEKYPEDLVFKAKYGGGQTISYCGGEPFNLFGFQGRPSFSANIRACKVRFMAELVRRLAEAYALTDKVEYAQAARRILLRLAEVYPHWLVHVGYGEYADLDPHLAALNIDSLPADEICPPPNLPDRRLHSGYWQGGRATGTGMEGSFVRQIVEAYELTCEARGQDGPIYPEAERLRIERDLLLESTVLLVADREVNNKSVGNATAVALVGMALGHPGMVRFGLDVFRKTVDGWFLADGGTSESWSYALMTLNGIESLGQAFRGYSDPPGYVDAEGQRLENLDLYHDTAYSKVWAAMFNGLQGNLLYPPLADGHRTSGLGARFAELMADNYPENPQYLALLRAIAGDDLAGGDSPYAIYYREPGLEEKPAPPLTFPDYLFPVLQIGYLRSGATGRDSLLVLSASDWGGHHHLDSLSLYYWQRGRELLSDLGYLWDHPQSSMTRRTFAHNTVLVDGRDQITQGRGGTFTLFHSQGQVKVMEAESQAYPQATLYRRTVAQVEHGPGRQYVADFFRVQGGTRHEYVFHGPNNDLQIEGPPLQPWQEPAQPELENLRGSDEATLWKVTWKVDPEMGFAALWANPAGQASLVGDGWGQRDYRNSDVGAKLPYFLRRAAAGPSPTVFVTVFEGFAPGQAVVKGIRSLPVPAAEADNAVALAVETDRGTDYLLSCLQARPLQIDTPEGPLETDGRFVALSVQEGQVVLAAQVEGTFLRWQGQDLPTGG